MAKVILVPEARLKLDVLVELLVAKGYFGFLDIAEE